MDISDEDRGARRRVRLHRDVLQPETTTRFKWRPLACRVRKAPRAMRVLTVYVTLCDPPITFAGYKIRCPLHRMMALTLGIQEGETRDKAAIAREYIEDAAMADATGTGGARGEATSQATAVREAEG